jgi:hypothetical protein
MTIDQLNTFFDLIGDIKPDEFHHGDCIGADKNAHDAVRTHVGSVIRVIGHPPTNPSKRAFCECDRLLEEKEYLARNKDIVNASSALVVTPKEFEEQKRSGTWSTYRYAKKQGIPIYLLLPDGTVQDH